MKSRKGSTLSLASFITSAVMTYSPGPFWLLNVAVMKLSSAAANRYVRCLLISMVMAWIYRRTKACVGVSAGFSVTNIPSRSSAAVVSVFILCVSEFLMLSRMVASGMFPLRTFVDASPRI